MLLSFTRLNQTSYFALDTKAITEFIKWAWLSENPFIIGTAWLLIVIIGFGLYRKFFPNRFVTYSKEAFAEQKQIFESLNKDYQRVKKESCEKDEIILKQASEIEALKNIIDKSKDVP